MSFSRPVTDIDIKIIMTVAVFLQLRYNLHQTPNKLLHYGYDLPIGTAILQHLRMWYICPPDDVTHVVHSCTCFVM